MTKIRSMLGGALIHLGRRIAPRATYSPTSTMHFTAPDGTAGQIRTELLRLEREQA